MCVIVRAEGGDVSNFIGYVARDLAVIIIMEEQICNDCCKKKR